MEPEEKIIPPNVDPEDKKCRRITSNSSSKTRGAATPRTRITWRLP